jgi:hypothetical protein
VKLGILYAVAGTLWGAYTARRTITEFGDEGSPKLAFTINSIIWPVSMVIATIKEKDVQQ